MSQRPVIAERYQLSVTGMADAESTVETALDLRLNRPVLVKRGGCAPDHAGATTEAVTREARLLGRLDHPNIVPVYDLPSDSSGRPCCVTRHLAGESLARVVAALREADPEMAKRFPLPQRLTIFLRICDAVEFAHANGVVHRELRLENVMLGGFGEVTVTGWNKAALIALEIGAGSSAGSSGQEPGVPAHERIAEDVRSLGHILQALLYPAASGAAENGGTACRTVPELTVSVPRSLRAVVAKVLAPDSGNGYETVADLRADIERIQNGFPPLALEQAWWRNLAWFVRRHWLACAAGLVVAVLMMAALVRALQAERQARRNLAEMRAGLPLVEETVRLLTSEGRFGEAVEFVTAAESLEPRNPGWKSLRGGLHLALLQFDLAAEAYEAALRLGAGRSGGDLERNRDFARRHRGLTWQGDERDLPPLEELVKLLGTQHREREAETVAARVTELKRRLARRDVDPWLDRRLMPLLAAHDLAGAREALRERVVEAPGNPAYHHLLGCAHQTLLDFTNAATAFEEALRRNADHPFARENLEWCRRHFTTDLHAHEQAVMVVTNLIGALNRQERFAEASFLSRRLTHLRPETIEQWKTRLRAAGIAAERLAAMRFAHDGLGTLDASGAPISDPSVLRNLPFADLNLESTGIGDLEVLRGLPLTRLNVNRNPVSSLEPLRHLPLNWLRFRHTAVRDLSPLEGMTFDYLELNATQVTNLAPLRNLTVTNLQLAINSLADLEPLRGQPLRTLNLSGSSVSNLEPLAGMPLEVLVLNRLPITNISVLSALPLQRLDLAGCARVDDLRPLLKCRQLESLGLPEHLADIGYLRTHPRLRWLNRDPARQDLPPAQKYLPAAEFWREFDRERRAAGR